MQKKEFFFSSIKRAVSMHEWFSLKELPVSYTEDRDNNLVDSGEVEV